MAICDTHPGLKAEIVVDGQPLEEYDDEDATPETVSKYVEALSGKDFAIKYTFAQPFPTQYGVAIKIRVDGAQGRVRAYRPEELYSPRGHFSRGVSFHRAGQWYIQYYRFTALNIVEEAAESSSVADLKKSLESKGSIKVQFRFITNIRDRDNASSPAQTNMLPAIGTIPEKALKGDALSHQATLSKPQRLSGRKPALCYDHVGHGNFAVFKFKYRSLAALRALRVVHRDDEESTTAVDGIPEDDMTPEQLRGALRHARRREEASRRMKQENVKREHVEIENQGDDDDEVTFVESRFLKRPRGEPEVIVLDQTLHGVTIQTHLAPLNAPVSYYVWLLNLCEWMHRDFSNLFLIP